MLPYLILFIVTVVGGLLLCEIFRAKWNVKIFLVAMSVGFLLFSMFRASTVGVDYQPYLDYFGQVATGGSSYVLSPQDNYRTEFGYGLLNYAISFFGSSQLVFAAGIAVVCIGLTMWYLYKNSVSLWLSLVIFVGYGFFGYTLCTIRHQIAICIFMFALPYLQKKKIVPYMLIVLLSATFHKSMLVLIPVYFLAQLALSWKTLAVYGAGTIFLLIFSEPIITFITQYVYQSYQVGTYYMQGRDLRTGLVPILTFVIVYLMRKKLLERNPANLQLMNLSLYSALLFVMTYKHFVFQRFALILLPVSMILLPEVVQCFAPPKEKLELLESLRQAGGKKQNSKQYGELRAELKDQRAMYYAVIAGVILLSFVYYLFLLSANRLLLVPYVTMWS